MLSFSPNESIDIFTNKPSSEAIKLWREALLKIGFSFEEVALMTDEDIAIEFKSKIKQMRGDF